MKYVLDASVAVKLVLPEADSDKAAALLASYQAQSHELLSPDVLPIEVAHALTRAERRNLLRQGDAIHKLADVLAVQPQLHAYLPLLPLAAEISSQTKVGVYDCLYVALAEQEQCEVVTADERMVKNLQGYPVVSLAALS